MSTHNEQNVVMLNAAEAYARWASFYDETPNPLLALEERLLAPQLEKCTGRDIVDLGCGTGRWLRRLEAIIPDSLTGIDSSLAMLSQAKKKCLPSTELVLADCLATHLPDRSADCVLASFILSYVNDLPKFAAEAARILLSDGKLIVSDLHPATPSYGWRRTFRAGRDLFEIAAFPYTLADLIAAMATAGFALEQIDEPGFGRQEVAVFQRNAMLDQFHRVASLPVIYLARFCMR